LTDENNDSVQATTRELCILRNDVEALGMASLFEEEGIDVIIFKRQDTAGPGVFDRDAPWGVARVAESDFDRAKSLWEDWLEAGPPEIGDDWKTAAGERETPTKMPPGAAGWMLFLLGVAVGCVAMYFYLAD
jgi:hypothetical protein